MDFRRNFLLLPTAIHLVLGAVSGPLLASGAGIQLPEDTPSVKSVEAQFVPVTQEQAKQWAAMAEQVVRGRDRERQRSAFEWSGFRSLVVADLTFTTQTEQELNARVSKQFDQGGVLAEIARLMGTDGTFRLLHVHTENGHQRTLFRLVAATGVLSYIDFVIVRGTDGTPKAIDAYAHLWGERHSAILRRHIEAASLDADSALASMDRCLAQGDPAAALQIYGTLPPSIRFQKHVLMKRYGTATALKFQAPHLSDSEVRATLDDLRKHYPRDTCLEFMAVDYYSSQKEWEDALAAIDRLDRAIGGDAYLHQLRGNVHFLKGDYESASHEFVIACNAVPDQPMAWLGAISVALVKKEHAQALKLMIQADKSAQMDWNAVRAFNGWHDYALSPEFDRWIEYLKS